MLDTTSWQGFKIGDFFDIRPTKTYKGLAADDLNDGGRTPFVVNSSVNNGIGGFSTLPPTEEGNKITFSDTTDGNTFFYQPSPFIGFSHVQGMYANGKHHWTQEELLFLTTILTFDSVGRYNYGRKMTRETIKSRDVLLPVALDGEPDWQYMQDFIRSLNYKPLGTNNKAGSALALDESSWEDFKIKDIFDLWYGVNLALNACTETNDGINFVSRTESNNGVSSRIAPVDGLPPQQAGLITTATGGSVLSTFLQPYPFYSGRDLYVMEPKEKAVGNGAKLFLTTVIEANKFKFNYGRQANKSLPHLKLRLPIKRNPDGTPVIDPKKSFHDDGYIPDWRFMEDYMRSLPYGDRIPGVGES
ncbi:restriction endonuclease subunit S [Lawsonella clevelandensis]|uniref:restriction endonuclease subunit S n=1 Tax=Lawsonella clevelandensis TaxID=1528099 RepID=UPI0006B4284A|nr:restriction endonuclease subunit S [Lawsonella clevelandensis]